MEKGLYEISELWDNSGNGMVPEDPEAVEKWLARIENHASLVIAKLIQSNKTDLANYLEKHMRLGSRDRELLCYFVALLLKKESLFHRGDEHWRKTKEECSDELNTLVDTNFCSSIDAAEALQMFSSEESKKNMLAISLTSLRKSEVPRILFEKGVIVLKIKKGGTFSFVFGDSPFIRTNDGEHLDNPSVELYLPLSPDTCIGFVHPRLHGSIYHFKRMGRSLSKQSIRVINGINSIIYGKSQAVCGNNKSTIRRAMELPIPDAATLNLGKVIQQ